MWELFVKLFFKSVVLTSWAKSGSVKYGTFFCTSAKDPAAAKFVIVSQTSLILNLGTLESKSNNLSHCLILPNYDVQQHLVKEYNILPKIKGFYMNLYCENQYQSIPVLNVLSQPATYFYLALAFLFCGLYQKNAKISAIYNGWQCAPPK